MLYTESAEEKANRIIQEGVSDIDGLSSHYADIPNEVIKRTASGTPLTILYVSKSEWAKRDRKATRNSFLSPLLRAFNMEIIIFDYEVLKTTEGFQKAHEALVDTYKKAIRGKLDIKSIISSMYYSPINGVYLSQEMVNFVDNLGKLGDKKVSLLDPLSTYMALIRWESLGKTEILTDKILEGLYEIEDTVSDLNDFKKDFLLHLKRGGMDTSIVDYVSFDIEATGLKLYNDEVISVSFTIVYTKKSGRYPHGHPSDLLTDALTHKTGIEESKYMKVHDVKIELAKDTLVAYFKNKDGKAFTLEILKMLKDLGIKVIGHNIYQFDIPMLSSSMKDNLTIADILTRGKFADTMVMAYSELNSINRPKLGLKPLSLYWAGNYDGDIDVTNLVNEFSFNVARYNAMDTIATVGIYERFNKAITYEIQGLKYHPEYLGSYESRVRYFNNSQKVGRMLSLMKLSGMPVAPKEYMDKEIKKLERSLAVLEHKLKEAEVIKKAEEVLTKEAYKKDNAKRKNKLTFEEYIERKGTTKFNFNSTTHKRQLFFNTMNFPKSLVEKTNAGQPSTGKEAINTLIEYVEANQENEDTVFDKELVEYMGLIKEYLQKDKLLNAYMKPINEKAIVIPSGYPGDIVKDRTLHTNFKQTSVMTGRLSTSEGVNFLALPAHGDMGTAVKKSFQAPKGWVFFASDYSALESRLLANESEDEEQAKPFVMGIDGHSLNTIAYFPDKMPDVVKRVEEAKTPEEYREAVNSVKTLYPELRQESKPYTFGFSYGAGAKKYGQELYDRFWGLYKKTADYYRGIEIKAKYTGYVISKISGLSLECSDINNPRLERYEVEAIKRKVGNFTIQSGNFLLLQAMADFVFDYLIPRGYLFSKVKIINSIHDACYMLVREDPALIAEVNNKWVELASRDYKENQLVKLEISADIGYDWKNVEELPMVATPEQVNEVLATKERITDG